MNTPPQAHLPMMIAHGDDALLAANIIVALVFSLSLLSLGFAIRKKKQSRSLAGITCAIASLLLDALTMSWGFCADFNLFSADFILHDLPRLAAVPLSLLGGCLSVLRGK